MQVLGAVRRELASDAGGIVGEDGLAGIVALLEPHALPAQQINGRPNLHHATVVPLHGKGGEKHHRNIAETAAAFSGDGWLRTGDLAKLGPFGTVLFEGRAKDVIKVGGYSVYALEVEQAIEEHPDVLEAAVVPLPDDRKGEVPGAVVRLRDGATLDEAALKAHCDERLAAYKIPQRWLAVDDLPRTGTNKVKRRELVSRFE